MTSISFQIRYIASNCQKINCSRLSRDSTNSAVRRRKKLESGVEGTQSIAKRTRRQGFQEHPPKNGKMWRFGNAMVSVLQELFAIYAYRELLQRRLNKVQHLQSPITKQNKTDYLSSKCFTCQRLRVRYQLVIKLSGVALEANADSIERFFYGYLFFLTLTLRK